jgi:hypothetical protein
MARKQLKTDKRYIAMQMMATIGWDPKNPNGYGPCAFPRDEFLEIDAQIDYDLSHPLVFPRLKED